MKLEDMDDYEKEATFGSLNIRMRIEGQYLPHPVTGCWIWLGGTNGKSGYGQITIENHNWTVFNFLYFIYRGEKSKGFVPDHLCRNKLCVNPYHLELVTYGENIRRGKKNTLEELGRYMLSGEDDNLWISHQNRS